MDVVAPDASVVRYDWRYINVQNTFFIDPLPTKITNELGNFQTVDLGIAPYGYLWGSPQPKVVTMPEGNRFEYTYDGRNNRTSQTAYPKPDTGLASIVTSAIYPISCTVPATCNKPTSVTDANGNQSNLTFASHGGILTEMGPASVTGGARPLKVTTWGQRYGYLKNSAGTLVAAATPVWVKLTETSCQTLAGASPAATCDAAAPQVVTTNLYGANSTDTSLMVKGVTVAADGQTLRTCYGYDLWGRRISETTPNANLGTCP